MKRAALILSSLACLAFLSCGTAPAQEPDAEGSKDHPMFNRMPGYYIGRYEDIPFDTHEFRDAALNPINVEGHVTYIRYTIQPGARQASRLQVLRNYENAIKKIGGTVLTSDYDGSSYLKVTRDGKEIWAHVSAYVTSDLDIYVVEKQAMAQDIVADAKAFSGDIKATGHAAVYGMYFDTGKSVLKPESEAALVEIAKLLSEDPGLRIYVVGHTDNVGAMDSNMKLSQARAEAVVQALVAKHKIAAARLKGYGFSSLAPVASNDSEEGRAKNRRVELVKM